MKTNNKQISQKKGMTLLELTVVILVLLTLISVLFIGAKAWKDGADRSNCILNIRNFQVAVRSYANMNQIGDRETIARADIVGVGKFMDAEPACPGNGAYSTGDVTYVEGSLTADADAAADTFLTCDYSGSGEVHVPNSVVGW